MHLYAYTIAITKVSSFFFSNMQIPIIYVSTCLFCARKIDTWQKNGANFVPFTARSLQTALRVFNCANQLEERKRERGKHAEEKGKGRLQRVKERGRLHSAKLFRIFPWRGQIFCNLLRAFFRGRNGRGRMKEWGAKRKEESTLRENRVANANVRVLSRTRIPAHSECVTLFE